MKYAKLLKLTSYGYSMFQVLGNVSPCNIGNMIEQGAEIELLSIINLNSLQQNVHMQQEGRNGRGNRMDIIVIKMKQTVFCHAINILLSKKQRQPPATVIYKLKTEVKHYLFI